MKDSYPTFWVDVSMGNTGICQGLVCKKFMRLMGEETASQKLGSKPTYKLVDTQLGNYYKFEAKESHWQVVPEFKNLTVRLITEITSLWWLPSRIRR